MNRMFVLSTKGTTFFLDSKIEELKLMDPYTPIQI